MTMELIGPGGEQHFTLTSWRMLLQLALRQGWRPAGAMEPDAEEEAAPAGPGEEPPAVPLDASEHEVPPLHPLAQALTALFPSGDDPVLLSYFFNGGFRVTPQDARHLADAVERALADVPDDDAMGHKTFCHPSEPGVRLVDIRTPVNPYEWFGGRKDVLRDFIRFCRQGGFEIW